MFNNVPIKTYELGNLNRPIKDILFRIGLTAETKSNQLLFDYYEILEEDTPETVSYKFYERADYHWIIMLINNIVDYQTDWPIPQYQMEQYLQTKYAHLDTLDSNGNVEVYGYEKTRHYEDERGMTVTTSVFPVSYATYENRLNDKKRVIKVLREEAVDEFVSQFEVLSQ